MRNIFQRILLIVVLLALIVIVVSVFLGQPSFKLMKKEVTLELGSQLVLDRQTLLKARPQVLEQITIDATGVNLQQTGQYAVPIHYENDQATLTVNIVDTTAPVADLKTSEPVATVDEPLLASDLITKVTDFAAVEISFSPTESLRELVFSTIGDQAATLYVTDQSGNRQSYPLQVHVRSNDVIAPVLQGADDQSIVLGTTFNARQAVTAQDDTDGDLTGQVEQSGTVNSFKAGIYPLTYTVTDQAGNTTRLERLITVTDPYQALRAANKFEVSKDPAVYAVLNPVLGYLGDRIRLMGIVYYDLTTGQGFSINKDAQFRSASTAKLFVNMALYDRVDQGKVSLDKKIYYQAGDYEGGTGVLQGMNLKVPYSLGTLADYAMKYSDNIAFNMIRRYLGRDYCFDYYESVIGHATNRTMTSMGAADGYKLMKHLYTSRSANSRHMLDMLKQTVFSTMLPKYLPEGIVAHKVGFYGSVYHDVGIVYAGDRPYIIAIYSGGIGQPQETIAQVSKLIYENR